MLSPALAARSIKRTPEPTALQIPLLANAISNPNSSRDRSIAARSGLVTLNRTGR
jgi:hypothetical protein